MRGMLVTGATGQQGGAVIKALLEQPDRRTKIRALTRNRQSKSAERLAAIGIEMFEGNLSHRESLLTALHGCDGAYLVTDFRGPDDVPGEIREGKLFIDCAKEAGEFYGATLLGPIAHD